MIIIYESGYSNPYDNGNHNNKKKKKEWITKIMKVLLAFLVIKTVLIEIMKLLVTTIMIITVIIINNINLQDIMKTTES